MLKRESWSEKDILALPGQEPETFERKGGRLFNDQENFLRAVAKALSAFANSGGGILVLGVDDDGATIDGLPQHVGRATMRDWIEQKLPNLLDYPLSNFRVHTVSRASNSKIPPDRDVIVVEVGDSASAPHQSVRDHIYYHRQGGRSVPARHFYLELLRNRATVAALQWDLQSAAAQAIPYGNGMYFVTRLQFLIHNAGHVAAHQWRFLERGIECPEGLFDGMSAGFAFHAGFPVSYFVPPRDERTILPDQWVNHEVYFGFQTLPEIHSAPAIEKEIQRLFSRTRFSLRLTCETTPGEVKQVSFLRVLEAANLGQTAERDQPRWFTER
ncbi:MAG: ATP-binding protein [Mesorhizobium sp.]|nr:ATP-binding protein [Mesorhizobium sp.]